MNLTLVLLRQQALSAVIVLKTVTGSVVFMVCPDLCLGANPLGKCSILEAHHTDSL